MKYTKNIGIKLKLLGFDFSYEHEDEEIKYEVWGKGSIEVTVDHTNREISTIINEMHEELNIKSLDQLEQLSKLINQ